MPDQTRLAVIIVNYRTPELVELCLNSLCAERLHSGPFEVIIVDGGSGDGSDAKIAAAVDRMGLSKWVTLMPLDFNGGFGWANNQAVLRLLQQQNPPDYIHFLNPDTELESGAVAALVATLDRNPEIGAVGSQLIEDGRPVASAFRFPSIAREFLHGSLSEGLGRLLGIKPIVNDTEVAGRADWVTGASFMVRSAALRQSGLFDHGFFLYFEEVELMLRINRAGWQIWHQPESRVRHIGGASTGVDSGATKTPRARPAYWFQSRQRYFAQAHGATYAFLANVAWLSGRLFWRVRCSVSRKLRYREIPDEVRGIMANGMIPKKRDRTSAIAKFTDAQNRLPFWSERE